MAQPSKFFPVFFGPDLDPAWSKNPGVLVDAGDVVPSNRGTLKSWTCATDLGITGYSEASLGTALKGTILKRNDGGARLYIGTKGRILEVSTALGFVDKSQAGGYSSTITDWTFTAFGNKHIACNILTNPQVIDTGTFSDLCGDPPKAALCCTQNRFVMLANYNDGTDYYQDGWWSGVPGTDWVPSIAKQTANGRLLDVPGPIRALVPMSENRVVAFKDDAIFVGSYVGGNVIWAWRMASNKVGCSSSSGVASIGSALFFLHRTGVYRFDGFNAEPIGRGVDKYLFNKMQTVANYATVQTTVDEFDDTVYFFFKDDDATDANNVTLALVYNHVSGQFGFIRYAWPIDTASAMRGVIPCSLADAYLWEGGTGTYTSNVLTFGYDAATTNIRLRRPSIGTVTSATVRHRPFIRTGDIGDETQNTVLTRIKPGLVTLNTTNMNDAQAYTKTSESDSYGSATTFIKDTTKRRWDGHLVGKLIQIYAEPSNEFELSGLTLTAQGAGYE